MPSPGCKVFISYHRTDLVVANRVRQHLSAQGISTWMDQYDIPSGAYWPDEIDKGLASAEIVLGVLSPDAVESRNVKNEWDWALLNGKRLLLLLARPCIVPHRYVSINFIDVSGDMLEAGLENLVRTAGIVAAASAAPIPRTRYALSNDLSVAWQESGGGDCDIVNVPGFVSHLEHEWRNPQWGSYLNRLGKLGRLIRFDKRGTGMSDRAFGVPTLEERMDDIRAVMDAAGSERAVLYGVSEGVPLSVQFAATYPDRTHALILYGGSATYVSRPDYPWPKSLAERKRQIAEDEATLADRWGTIAAARESIDHFCPSLSGDEDFVAWSAEQLRLAASPGAAIALDRMNLEVDVRSILPVIRVPTLVVHRVDEYDADIGEARYLAAHIPGAVLKELPGNDHFPIAGDQNSFFNAIEDFLATLGSKESTRRETDSVLATVARIRFDRAADYLGKKLLDQIGTRYRSRTVQAMGFDVVAAFDGAARALRFADEVMTMAGQLGLQCRGAAHAGELIFADQQVTGPLSKQTANLVDLASLDEIIASQTVRDLVAGSGIQFRDVNPAQKAGFTEVPVVGVDRLSLT